MTMVRKAGFRGPKDSRNIRTYSLALEAMVCRISYAYVQRTINHLPYPYHIRCLLYLLYTMLGPFCFLWSLWLPIQFRTALIGLKKDPKASSERYEW